MRRAGRVDSNQSQVVAELRDFGISVFITSALGDGFPDLVCGFMGINGIYELKDPEKDFSKQQLTADEKRFHNDWAGDVQVAFTSTEIIHDLLRKANAQHNKDPRTRNEREQPARKPR